MWNDKFFKKLASRWGNFIQLDETNFNRERLDITRVHVRVLSKLDMPLLVKIIVGELSLTILVSIENKYEPEGKPSEDTTEDVELEVKDSQNLEEVQPIVRPRMVDHFLDATVLANKSVKEDFSVLFKESELVWFTLGMDDKLLLSVSCVPKSPFNSGLTVTGLAWAR